MTLPDRPQEVLWVESYLWVEYQIISANEIARLKSDIVDAAVRRRMVYESNPSLSVDTRALIQGLGKLEEKLDSILKHHQKRKDHSMTQRRVTLSRSELHFRDISPDQCLAPGTFLSLRFLLPPHEHEDVLILAETVEPKNATTLVAEFRDMANDQAEWIAKYLIQRQREQMLKSSIQKP